MDYKTLRSTNSLPPSLITVFHHLYRTPHPSLISPTSYSTKHTPLPGLGFIKLNSNHFTPSLLSSSSSSAAAAIILPFSYSRSISAPLFGQTVPQTWSQNVV